MCVIVYFDHIYNITLHLVYITLHVYDYNERQERLQTIVTVYSDVKINTVVCKLSNDKNEWY